MSTSGQLVKFLVCFISILPATFFVAGQNSVAANITIDTMLVGNAGNGADTTGFGSVGYEYRIGTTEVTNAQYVVFLNSVDASGANSLSLYHPDMSATFGGIDFNSSAPIGSKYSLNAGRENKPINYISFFDALRFTNWLSNGQGNGDTETGAYTLLGGTEVPSNASSITRNPGATWFLPSEDEWYKAAFHKNDGTTANYFEYATSSDTAPTAEVPSGGTNSANYDHAVGDSTDAGAYINSVSPYGTFDQGGNMWEWNETLTTGTLRGVRGSSQIDGSEYLSSSEPLYVDHLTEANCSGFRVATVPEPSSLALAIFAAVGVLISRRRYLHR